MKVGRPKFVIAIAACVLAGFIFHSEPVAGKQIKAMKAERAARVMAFTARNYPRVDGSTSAHPLQVLIACKLLNVPYQWHKHPFIGEHRVVPSYSKGKENAQFIEKMTRHHGTHGAYVNLIEGKADVILVARRPSEDELKLARERAVELDVRPVALDAFAFIMNVENPVRTLTLKQIQEIYTGKITNWKEVGGGDTEIKAYQRDRNSGSQELMKQLVMKDLEMIDAPRMVLMGMSGPINRLSRDKQGIGYTVYFYKEYMARDERIKFCAVDGILPSYDTIKAKKYPLTTEVFVVIRQGQNAESPACRFRDWLLAEEGQAAVKESGYVPIGRLADYKETPGK